ncbi:histone-like nucleoid-structuring protein Lsr2 [Brachybacterium hainanense]|uniref:Lsr2 family protein n=1 Tax=Brachybacterium hainanense TaxID=1541174 RepID=A0ABV6RCR0_9MICO
MAKKTFVELVDDLDGTTATGTVSFGLDGVEYEIDLSDENAEKLRSALGEWTAKARRTGGRRARGTGTSAPSGDASRIREWARGQGIEVSDRGRISAGIREAYLAAH